MFMGTPFEAKTVCNGKGLKPVLAQSCSQCFLFFYFCCSVIFGMFRTVVKPALTFPEGLTYFCGHLLSARTSLLLLFKQSRQQGVTRDKWSSPLHVCSLCGIQYIVYIYICIHKKGRRAGYCYSAHNSIEEGEHKDDGSRALQENKSTVLEKYTTHNIQTIYNRSQLSVHQM